MIIKPPFKPSNNFVTSEFAFFSPENTKIPAFNEQLQHCNTSLISPVLIVLDGTDSLGAGEGFWEQPGAGAVPGQGWDVRMLPFRRSIDVSGSFQSSPARLGELSKERLQNLAAPSAAAKRGGFLCPEPSAGLFSFLHTLHRVLKSIETPSEQAARAGPARGGGMGREGFRGSFQPTPGWDSVIN